MSSNYPSNPPFGQQPEGQAPSAPSGAAPQQPAWGSGAQPGQQQWGQQPGQQQWGQQPAGYGYQAPAAGAAQTSKMVRWFFVAGFGTMAFLSLINFIMLLAASGQYYSPGAWAIISTILEIAVWGVLTFGAWKLFDILDEVIAKAEK